MKKSGKQRWETFRWVCLLLVWVLVAVVASQLVVGLIMRGIIQIFNINTAVSSTAVIVNGVYSLISYAAALALILLVPKKFVKKLQTSREELGVKNGFSWMDIGLAPIAYVVATLLAALLVGLFSIFPWFDAAEAQDVGFNYLMNGGERIVAFIVLVVLAPAVEEVIFRGWLYGKLRSRLNTVVSILLTSLLFALVHFQWNVSVNVFALSVVLCVLREITGTVYAGILTHMIKNGVAFYLLYVLGM